MARNKKVLPLLEKVTITDVAAEGKAIAKVNDLVVFVPYVVPGDVVDLQIKRKKNHYAEAEAVKFHEYSPVRAVPFCDGGAGADPRYAAHYRLQLRCPATGSRQNDFEVRHDHGHADYGDRNACRRRISRRHREHVYH